MCLRLINQSIPPLKFHRWICTTVSVLALVGGSRVVQAQDQASPPTAVPNVSVTAPKNKPPGAPPKKRRARTAPTSAPVANTAPAAPKPAVTTPKNTADYGTASPQSGGFFVPNQSFGPIGTIPAKDIPFSTNSIPQALIADQQAHSVDEALKNDPSVRAFPTTVGFAQNLLIRGFMTNTTYNTFQDGLDLLSYGQPAIENNERIDILKGSAAIFYGFAPPAGVVNYVSKQPLDTPLNEIGIGFISNGTVQEHVDVSRRTPDGFGIRATVYQQNGDLPVDDTSAARGAQTLSADWKTDEARIWATFQHYAFKDEGGNPAINFTTLHSSMLPAPPNPSNLFGQTFFRQSGETTLASTGLDWSHDGWTVSAAAGYSGNSYNAIGQQFPGGVTVAANGAVTAVAFANTLAVENNAERASVSKEVQLGYFTNTTYVSFNHSEHELGTGNGTAITLGPSNIYNPVFYAAPSLTAFDTTNIDTHLTNTLIYNKFDIGRYVSLIGGGVNTQYQAKTSSLVSGATLSYLSQQDLTPLAAVQVRPIDYITIYGSYIQSLQPGQIAGPTLANANQVLPPFVGEQKEVGVKADLNTALSANAALFEIKQAAAFTTSANVLTEQGQQVNRGLEMTVAGKVSPEVKIFGGVDFIDPRVYNNTTFYDGQAPGVSKERVSMFGEYAPEALHGVTFMAGVYYSSKFLVQENSLSAVAAGAAQDVYAQSAVTADLGLKYQFVTNNVPLTFRAYVANIFNEGYWFVANPSNNGQVIIGQPRTFSLELSARF